MTVAEPKKMTEPLEPPPFEEVLILMMPVWAIVAPWATVRTHVPKLSKEVPFKISPPAWVSAVLVLMTVHNAAFAVEDQPDRITSATNKAGKNFFICFCSPIFC